MTPVVGKQTLAAVPFPDTLVLTPVSRNPLQLRESTVEIVMRHVLESSARRPEKAEQAAASPKKTSIIVVTFNNLLFNCLCFESLLANTAPDDYELIVVDNGSADGTRDYLRALSRSFSHVRLILNESNVGFAPAVNQGLANATGSYLVLLNNDTLLSPDWLSRLLKPLDDANIGLVGPVTNRTGNEAQIDVRYETYGELLAFSRQYCRSHAGESFDIPMLAMFCTAMRRDVWDKVGLLDERFEIGLFEDEDYSMRVRDSGYRVVCAEDAFVHHFGQASLGKLAFAGQYGALFHANRRRFEEKWGVKWAPHRHRTNPEYRTLVQAIRATVSSTIPRSSAVVVVSKGDPELLEIGTSSAWHFPQNESGAYSGHYPADSAEAIDLLEAARSKGAEFLLFPCTAFWWLQYYKEFAEYLYSNFHIRSAETDTCMIFALNDPNAEI